VRELELIAAIRAALEDRSGRLVRWTGDDAAVVRARPLAVTSIDTIVEGAHFRLTTHSAGDVGWKALATALSDIAAMGADAGEAYVSLVLPDGFEDALELVAGMEEVASQHGVTIAGGDIVRGGVLTVTVAVTGWADSDQDLARRDGARPGDLVGVTGELGGSEAGRRALEAGHPSAHTRRHLRPRPRLNEGAALVRAGISAMIDVSDGLATDARHLADASGAQLVVRMTDVPCADGVAAEAAVTGGDDYELLVTVPSNRRAAAEAATGLAWIGDVRSGSGLVLVPEADDLSALRGYEHA